MQSYKKELCKAVKADGSKCRVAAIAQSTYCYFHDPSLAAERREAQAAGGRVTRAKTLDPATPDTKIQNSQEALALISETIHQVRTGEIDPHVANSVGYLANIAMRVFEQRDLETRIATLERLIESRDPVPDLTLTGD
jgi:hypothetical protein